MCCFRLLHETISLQFGYKDSANREQKQIERSLKFDFAEMQPILRKAKDSAR